MKKLTVFAIYACVYMITQTIRITTTTGITLSEIFKQFLFSSDTVDHVSKLRDYQWNILKSRNAEYLFHKYAKLDDANITNQFTEFNDTKSQLVDRWYDYIENNADRSNFTHFMNESVSEIMIVK